MYRTLLFVRIEQAWITGGETGVGEKQEQVARKFKTCAYDRNKKEVLKLFNTCIYMLRLT